MSLRLACSFEIALAFWVAAAEKSTFDFELVFALIYLAFVFGEFELSASFGFRLALATCKVKAKL